MNHVLTLRSVDIAVRMRVMKCGQHGCETWTISGDMMKNFEAMETWVYRRIRGIVWKVRVTNEHPQIIIDRYRS